MKRRAEFSKRLWNNLERKIKMGIISRFADIMKSNINALLDKAEDPAKMVDQYLLDLRENLADVKKETAGVIAAEAKAKRDVEEAKEKVEKADVSAHNALKAGDEDAARKLIAEKQRHETLLADREKAYALAHENAEKMRQMYDKLVEDIRKLEDRKANIKAKSAAAKAQSKINEMTSGMDSAASMEAFDRMEAKADEAFDRAMAEAELNVKKDTVEDLVEKYGSDNTSVDDELAKMKAELGL